MLEHSGGLGSAPLVVTCNERLPTGSRMKLVWGKGIRAANGTPSRKEESFIYQVREPFKATLSCEREKLGAPCSPLLAITLSFNAPFDAQVVGKIQADGRRRVHASRWTRTSRAASRKRFYNRSLSPHPSRKTPN
ncbi:MAG: hypothetical protein IPJ38_19735 [Dechloromonas sp.]|uniref:Uncharacterized protein n=1 Tax=Candidatus Dechloromonas phosphorivorans TaxID=2899244 RepID=A0A935KE30_9RHOO|nr:hypothetical protein [Candidatus Dechloromonas phosphorivorans]